MTRHAYSQLLFWMALAVSVMAFASAMYAA
jgi:hypothetical protein